MIPGRGLRPHHLVSPASRVSLSPRGHAPRKFSSVSRAAGLATLPCPQSSLHSAPWRATAAPKSTAPRLLPASSVRYGSWYAPWSWGRTSAPPETLEASKTPSEPATGHVEPTASGLEPEPVVTSTTPELAPASIDQPAVVGDVNAHLDELLRAQLADPGTSAKLPPLIEPSEMISYWGQLKDLGLDYGWGPSALFESLMELTYLHAGLGWAGSVVLSTMIIRCGLFYFQMRASDAGAKIAAMKPALQPIMDELEDAKRMGDSERAEAAKRQQGVIMREAGGFDAVLSGLYMPVLQAVVGFGAYRCLRGMSSMPVPGLSGDGLLWFTDLTVSDPYYVLPVLTGGIMYAVIKAGGESGMSTEVQMTSMQKKMMLVMPFLMMGISSFQPAAIQLYFVCTTTLGGITSRLLRQPAVRRVLGLRLLPTKESQAFYSKVIKGEASLKDARLKAAKLHYKAPNRPLSPTLSTSSKKSHSASASTLAEIIAIKPGTKLPAHLRPATAAKAPQEYADRDTDYDVNFWKLSFAQKRDWIRRNFRPIFLWNRFWNFFDLDKRDWRVKQAEHKKQKAKEAAEEYEEARKKRLQGR